MATAHRIFVTGEGMALSRWHLTLAELRARAPLFARTAVAVGNFDGVHVGHAHILQLAIRHAVGGDEMPIALTFDPHPRAVVGTGAPPALVSPDERDRRMLELGIQAVVSLRFDNDVAGLTPEKFVRDVLVESLGARRVVVGDNFRFGRGAQGTTALLKEMGDRFGFAVHVAAAVRGEDGRVVSSSLIRRLISEGEVAQAAALLRRPHVVCGRISEPVRQRHDADGIWYEIELGGDVLLPPPGKYEASVVINNGMSTEPSALAFVTAVDEGAPGRRLLVSGPLPTVDDSPLSVRIGFLSRLD